MIGAQSKGDIENINKYVMLAPLPLKGDSLIADLPAGKGRAKKQGVPCATAIALAHAVGNAMPFQFRPRITKHLQK